MNDSDEQNYKKCVQYITNLERDIQMQETKRNSLQSFLETLASNKLLFDDEDIKKTIDEIDALEKIIAQKKDVLDYKKKFFESVLVTHQSILHDRLETLEKIDKSTNVLHENPYLKQHFLKKQVLLMRIHEDNLNTLIGKETHFEPPTQ